MCQKITIIAEAGVNHNGSLELACKLIDVAAEAGADIIKFQTFVPEAVISAHAPKAAYQKMTTNATESQLDMIRKLYLSMEQHKVLLEHCRDRNIRFLSTPFDEESVTHLCSLGLTTLKIPSGEITNVPYLRRVGASQCAVIMSTGMARLAEVGTALHILELAGTPQERVTLLHCTTEYPAPMADVNLNAMRTMRVAFPRVAGVGYSDHTEGIEISIAAAALGAQVLEKHLTLDKTMDGPDHKASLEPQELQALVRAVRNVSMGMGDGDKRPMPSEVPNIPIARKSLVAARDIARGEVFTPECVTTKRPGTGLSPLLWDSIMGTTASRAYAQDDLL